jgi:hypothetical protein
MPSNESNEELRRKWGVTTPLPSLEELLVSQLGETARPIGKVLQEYHLLFAIQELISPDPRWHGRNLIDLIRDGDAEEINRYVSQLSDTGFS